MAMEHIGQFSSVGISRTQMGIDRRAVGAHKVHVQTLFVNLSCRSPPTAAQPLLSIDARLRDGVDAGSQPLGATFPSRGIAL